MYVCNVNRTTGSTVWKGSAFNQCPGKEIIFINSESYNMIFKSCNNIGAKLCVTNDSSVVSQVRINVTSDLIGKTASCYYDDGISETLVRNFTVSSSTRD